MTSSAGVRTALLRSPRWRLGLLAAAGLCGAVVVALLPAEAGASYCGRVLYDSTNAASCDAALLWRRLLAGALALLAVAAFVTGRLWGVPAGRRVLRAVSAALALASVACALVVANRLLQPVTSEYCGSLINRHRTYEQAIEQRCDHLLVPYRTAAITLGVAGLVLLVTAVLVAQRGRRAMDRCYVDGKRSVRSPR